MRLSEAEQQAILTTAREIFGADVQVRLFGSRADDSARGGDIDLLVDVPGPASEAQRAKVRFLVELKRKIGDRKIDVVIRGADSTPKPVYAAADMEGITLQ